MSADQKISTMTAAPNPIDGTEKVEIVQSGGTFSSTIAFLANVYLATQAFVTAAIATATTSITAAYTAAIAAALAPYSTTAQMNTAIAAAVAALQLPSFAQGGIIGAASGTVTKYYGLIVSNTVNTVSLQHAAVLRSVRVHAIANPALTNTLFEVLKNGTAVANVSVTAGVTGDYDIAGPISYAAGDTFIIRASNTNAGTGSLDIMISLFWSPA